MSLSPRQEEVAALMALGLTNRQIAAQLGIAYATVKVHASAIYARLGVATRTQAALRLAQS